VLVDRLCESGLEDASTSIRRRCASGAKPSSTQTKTLKKVGTEMALHVLAYNLKRVMAILTQRGRSIARWT
jgi:hypothetical protein